MRKRRTLLAAVLLVIMVLMLAACGGGSGSGGKESSKFAGKWKITTIKAMGIEMSMEQLANFGLDEEQTKMISDFAIDFQDGGKAVFTAGGETADGTWEEKDENTITLKVSSDTMECKLEDNKLVMDMEELTGMEMTANFEKQS